MLANYKSHITCDIRVNLVKSNSFVKDKAISKLLQNNISFLHQFRMILPPSDLLLLLLFPHELFIWHLIPGDLYFARLVFRFLRRAPVLLSISCLDIYFNHVTLFLLHRLLRISNSVKSYGVKKF